MEQQTNNDKLLNKPQNLKDNAIAPKEGKITKEIEKVTSQIPSGGYLTLALGSMALSAALAVFSKRKTMANFVGLWVPTLMLVGIYNKIVKVEGSDKLSANSPHQNLH